ncbi:thioesterase family protein [Nocardioides sp. InS609-2]|uniref:acyl-CoA thioesterase n=1 Tax=Nocardioides sp. InS609-2 TaxID=2760705 RepID=UPI0020BE6C62|nr:thioesterase family protein [Nocardioides sp. InS609-2]
MRHVYECPMRWADLDLLGHVNNVVYVDYLQEARVDMIRKHVPASRPEGAELTEGVVVVRHEVSYLAPLTFRFRPIRIECWVTELRAASFTMGYEVFDEDDAGRRTTYLRATTVLTPYVFATGRPRRISETEREILTRFLEPTEKRPRVKLDPPPEDTRAHFPLYVRFSDVDVYGHVNNVKYFEYFQESRIQMLSGLTPGLGHEHETLGVVVAQTDVDYRVPILFREEPYDVWAHVSHVGNKSFTIESEIRDGDTLLSRARVVVVVFDAQTQRSTEPSAEYRARLTRAS